MRRRSKVTVAIVGAGIAGASAALALSRRGHRITVYERFGPGHRRGSSHGPSRIVRKAYSDSAFTEIAAEAYPFWRELDEQAGGGILNEVGALYFGDVQSQNVIEVAEGLSRVNETYHVLDAREAKAVVPALRLDRNEIGIFTPAAGWVDA
ncbi:FAD-dependent oxidoreductase, partial [bacterium]